MNKRNTRPWAEPRLERIGTERAAGFGNTALGGPYSGTENQGVHMDPTKYTNTSEGAGATDSMGPAIGAS
jgi:hypothetical protein